MNMSASDHERTEIDPISNALVEVGNFLEASGVVLLAFTTDAEGDIHLSHRASAALDDELLEYLVTRFYLAVDLAVSAIGADLADEDATTDAE